MGKRRYGRHTVETSNESKIFFPDCRLTKGGLIDYYERIADRILPYLKERPLVLQRFPEGIEGEGFYQKQASDYFPDWITRVRVEVGSSNGSQELVVCDKKATLVYLANQACIALHPWPSRTGRLDHPDLLVIDLDPPRRDFEAARRAALQVRDLLDDLGLMSYPKLTGSRGVHIRVPLNRSERFDEVRAFARKAMEVLASLHPDELTTEHRKDKRLGRLYLDVGRNAYGQTAVAPWSVRPLPQAPVARPLTWDALQRLGLGPRGCTVKNGLGRTWQRADPWAGFRRRARALQRARQRLATLADAGRAD